MDGTGMPIVTPENRPDNVKFEKIWNRAKDCDVASVVLHANNRFLCMDDRHTLTADEVIDCYKHGCIIEANGVYYRPVSLEVKGNAAGVRCIDCSSDPPTRLTFTSYYPS